ncbi:MAG: DUF3833 domain-containing protein [Bacteriovoracaceae bacterium]|nr:DUF3833 domain-containing protein [Bacteriovoracaceae bacterium]
MKILINAAIALLFISCSGQQLSSYEKEQPTLELKEFFKGKIYALGIVQSRSGEVIQRFQVDIIAHWDGDVATLDESFVYSDGSTSKRIWTLKEIAANEYEGRAADVIGKAKGKTAGNAFQFRYDLDVPVGDSTYKIHINDWMYLLDNNTLLARSYMSKFGFDVGEVTIVMMKERL